MLRYRNILFVILISFLVHDKVISQKSNVDSLKKIINSHTSPDSIKINSLIQLGDAYEVEKPDKAIKLYQKAANLAEQSLQHKDDPIIQENYRYMLAKAYRYIAYVHKDNSRFKKAIDYFQKELVCHKTNSDSAGIVKSKINMGVCYYSLGDYMNCMNVFQSGLKMAEERHNLYEINMCYNNMGVISIYMKDYEKGVEYLLQTIKYSEMLNDSVGVAYALNNISSIFIKTENYDSALYYSKKALAINRAINNSSGLSRTLNNYGIINKYLKKFDQAIVAYSEAYQINQDNDDQLGMASVSINIGNILLEKKDYSNAIVQMKKGLNIAEKIGAIYEMKDACQSLSIAYSKISNFQEAYNYHLKYSEINDSIYTKENSSIYQEMEAKYQNEKQQHEIDIQNVQLEKKDAEVRRKTTITYSVIIVLILVLLLGLLALYSLIKIRRANKILAMQKQQIQDKNEELNQQNEEIEAQRDEIERQRDQYKVINKQITESIRYAKRIQKAVLPPEEYVTKSLPEHFILFMPRDIVSGDFYWATTQNDHLIIAAADCTGHGVPGAFMSMLGIAFLNEIVNKDSKLNANQILNQLKTKIVQSLHQTGKDDEAKDGMDIALCILDMKTRKIQYSGANNPLWILHENEITEIKPDKMPIGIYNWADDSFTNHELDISTNDTIYIFSDGYVDQFGGTNQRKFGKRRLQEKLIEIHQHSMDEQKKILKDSFIGWKGNEKQIDDILIIGIKL